MSPEPFVIIVGVDYSELSDLALARAFEIAGRDARAEIHALHVLAPFVLEPSLASTVLLQDSEAAISRLKRHVERKLLTLVERSGGDTQLLPARVVSHVRIDATATGVAQLAADLQADLVIVGTHGRHGVSRLLMGSVAEAVVRWAPCPVLVMRPKAVAAPTPVIEPPCPRCLDTRAATHGDELWCEQHRARHGRRHTYHQTDRAGAETEFPLVTPAK
jgi:nucleotide-binding universal stress UspA family protein